MKRWIIFAYGVASYALFLGVFVYAIGFVGGFGTPTSLDATPTRPLGTALAIDLGSAGAFAVQHSGMARGGFKRWWTRIIPEAAERSTYVLASSLAMVALFVFWEPIGGTVWTATADWLRDGLIALNLAGWVLLLYTTFLIDHFDLFGLAQVWRQLRGTAHAEPRFRTPSLYRLVRHPLYVGWLVIFWAAPTMTAAHLLFALVTTAYILVAIRLEERDLLRFHGADYAAWRARTPMLLPRLFGSRKARALASPALSVALVLLAATAAVHAGERVDTPSLVVRYTQSQLHNPEGARQLYARIRSTAGAVCAAHDGASLERRMRYDACRKSTVDRAIAAFDSPLLRALHAGQSSPAVAWAAR